MEIKVDEVKYIEDEKSKKIKKYILLEKDIGMNEEEINEEIKYLNKEIKKIEIENKNLKKEKPDEECLNYWNFMHQDDIIYNENKIEENENKIEEYNFILTKIKEENK